MYSKPILFLLLILAGLNGAFAQQMVISGFVRDSLNNEPLIGATIWEPKLQKGAVTDRFGHYTIYLSTQQPATLKFSFIGYQPKNLMVNSETERLDVYMQEGVNLSEILVKGEQKIENRIEMGVISIPVRSLKTLPSIGEPDVLKTLQLMPGIQGGSEGRSGLYVRGGSPDQNLILLDGASIHYANHFGNFLSLFHPEIISNMELYKGSFPAKYGGRLSSVLDLRMREGNKKEHHGSFGIGLLSADILLEGPIKKDTTSYIFSARRFYLDAVMLPFYLLVSQGYFSLGYDFYDLYGKISHTINENNRLFFSAYAGNDQYKIRINPFNVDDDFKGNTGTGWGNILATTRLNSKINQRMLMDVVGGYTRYHNTQSEHYQQFGTDTTTIDISNYSTVSDFFLKTDFDYNIISWYQMNFGLGVTTHFFQPGIKENQYFVNGKLLEENSYSSIEQLGIESYLYHENILRPYSFLKMNLGFRLSSYFVDKTNYMMLEPRVVAVLGNEVTGALKFAYNRNMQPLHLLSYQTVGTPTDLFMPATKNIAPAKGSQWSVGYSKSFLNDFEFSVEAYHKQLSNLIAYKDGASYTSTKDDWQNLVETHGEGTSIGLEVLLKKSSGKTTGWVGYTLAKTDRFFENKNNGNRYPYIYDRRHDFSIALTHKFNEKYSLSASWVYGTGYPMTLELGYYNNFELPGWRDEYPTGTNPFVLDDDIVLYSSKNGIRMGNSHRLDLGFQIHGKTKKGRDKTWSFNIYNAYNQQNPAYYYYGWLDRKDHSKGKTLWQQSGIPIIPSFTYRVKW